MASESVWVVPNVANVNKILAQIVLNAVTKAQAADNSQAILTLQVSLIRGAIQTASRVPLSQVAGTIPPESEFHAYVLTANALTAGIPNLGTVVVTLNGGVVSPWNDLVKKAQAWLSSIQGGQTCAMPSTPQVRGNGRDIIFKGTLYDNTPQIIATLQPGYQYYFTPGPNEVQLVCGTVTLTAEGSFYAPTANCVITGNAVGNPFTGSLQKATLAANLARSGRIIGQVELTTPGPDICWDDQPTYLNQYPV